MNTLQQRIVAFVKLGSFLSQFSNEGIVKEESVEYNELFFDGFKHQIKLAQEHNGWFIKENILYAATQWAQALTAENITNWLQHYNIEETAEKKVAVIMAGNIPLVGFHDFMCVLLSGHSVVVKQSSNDKQLLPFLAKYLEYVEPSLKGKITFTDEKLIDYDAVIATGSDNTARYFEYYFGKKPNIIRKNRNSVAVLTGNETKEELEALGEDVFRYFGLGCRSVSKLFVPKNYNFDDFFGGMYRQSHVMDINKYANNYDYNKAVYLMSLFDLLENGFLMLKEDESYASPIATVFYEYYDDADELRNKLQQDRDKIQCIVSKGLTSNEVSFGETQQPKLSDYADGVDTIEFLLKI